MTTPHEIATSGAPEGAGPPEAPPPVRASAVAAVLAFDGELDATVVSIRAQAYGVDGIVVIGEGSEVEAYAGSHDFEHYPTLGDFVWAQTGDIDFVWVVHGDSTPRPDALSFLVGEAERNDAAVVGSKIVDAADPERLESVGAATDVYGEPYTGLDEGEVDLAQYDVVREVAFVNGVSMLVRRDLLRGLGGMDELLPPVAGGLDLSQRARLAGGRVLVAPAAEVLHDGRCEHALGSWRETAGRMRAMLKIYRPVTLAWVIPVDLFILMLDGLARVFLGAPRRIGEALAAIGWNLRRLPSTLSARRAAQSLRTVGDEEVFRYQVSGSARMRELGHDVGARWQHAVDREGALGGLASRLSGSAALAAGLSIAVMAVAARGLWFSTPPVVGYSLPLSDTPGAVVSAYAGGWNPGGLGGPHAIHPVAALTAAVRWTLFGWSGTLPLLTAAAMLFGLFGFARLLRRLEVSGPARYAASLVGMLGPAWLWLAGRAYWPALLALAALPWAVDAAVRPRPESPRGRLGVLGLTMVAFGVVAAAAPAALLVPAAVAPLVRGSVPLRLVVRRLGIGLAAGVAVLGPYLASASISTLASGGVSLDREVVWWVWAIPAAAAVLVVAAAGRRWPLAAGGLSLAGFGVAIAVVAPWEMAVAGMLAAATGLVLVAAGALAAEASAGAAARVRTAALVAGAALVLTIFPSLPGGRAGLPEDRWGQVLEFAASLETTPGESRLLLVGDPGDLPGAVRLGPGFAYRVVNGDRMTLDQAWLPPTRGGDRELESALESVSAGAGLRPGEQLAPFGVRWVVVSGTPPFREQLAALDLVPKPLAPEVLVLENLSFAPRAVADSGVSWAMAGGAAEGPPEAGRVRIADNAADGWGPDGSADGWAVGVSAAEGRAAFARDPVSAGLAVLAGLVLVAGLVGAVIGRGRS